jgi:hypothetical protein
MKRSLLFAVLAVAVSVVPAASAAKVAKKPVTPGFYRGKSIGYFDFGPIKLKPGNTLAPIWTVTIKKTSTVVNCPVLGFNQKRVAGFSAGKVIHYYDLGPVKVAPGNVVAPLYAPTNGVAGQHNVTLETVQPGQTDYPPLWGIIMVTWKAGAHKRLLTSAAQIKQAQAAGDLTVHKTALVVNCPVVP